MRFDPVLPMDDFDFFVWIIPFQSGKQRLDIGNTHGILRSNPDDTYSLFIDANATIDQQIEAYWHEYEHLAYEDFSNGRPIEEAEENLN